MENIIKQEDVKITRYISEGKYIIDIIENSVERESWISRKDYCAACFMFGCKKSDTTEEEYIDMVMNAIDEYKHYYDKHVAI